MIGLSFCFLNLWENVIIQYTYYNEKINPYLHSKFNQSDIDLISRLFVIATILLDSTVRGILYKLCCFIKNISKRINNS